MEGQQSLQDGILTFGEIILRLSPKEKRRMQQAQSFDFYFGGTEFNVAAALAHWGRKVNQVSAVPEDFTGEAALAALHHYNIGSATVQKGAHPLGIYFMEEGVGLRAGRIAYNRLNGAFANIDPAQIDWQNMFQRTGIMHWTGISPGISKNAYTALKEGLVLARKNNLIVTADPAYRKNLWNWGRDGHEVLSELMHFTTIFIGGPNEINEILKTTHGNDRKGFENACQEMQQAFPTITHFFDKVRKSKNASCQSIMGRAWNGTEYLESQTFEIDHIVDRIGTGDAFAAGLIYGIPQFDDAHTLAFATASCALKHTILGDVNLVSSAEIEGLLEGSKGGRINR